MALIVGVHGIAQQLKGPAVLNTEWWPPIRDGVGASGCELAEGALVCAFYGGLFRPPGKVRGTTDPAFRAADVSEPFEKELLRAWWVEAATAEPDRVVSPNANVRLAVPGSVQAGLRALSHSRFFMGIAEQALIGSLKQVRRYIHEPAIRLAAQDSVNAVVTSDTRVIVAHSLGSVVAYEALHRYAKSPNWANVRTLVTLGSPLGIRNLIFSALVPPPENGKGKWPPLLERWVNLSADNDVVALEKWLGHFFDGSIVDVRIDNEAKAHDISPYLTAPETGAAIADGLPK